MLGECARCCFNLLDLGLLKGKCSSLGLGFCFLFLLLDFLLFNSSSCLDHRCEESLLVKSKQFFATQAAQCLGQVVRTLTKGTGVDFSLTHGRSSGLERCSGCLLEGSTYGLLDEVLVLFYKWVHILLLHLNLRGNSRLLDRLGLELHHLYWFLLRLGLSLGLGLNFSLRSLHRLDYLLLLSFCLLD